MKKILVVHPYDESTLQLERVYSRKSCDVLHSRSLGWENVYNALPEGQYDRVFLLGHGTSLGLCNMETGDTVFGDHETLVARVPALMASTAEAIRRDVHPMIVAARFHGFFEYLHPFRDGNGRTGRLMSNWILLHAGHPLLIIDIKDRAAYINALRQIRSEGTDEFLVAFFFRAAISRMESELSQKRNNTHLGMFLF